MSIPLPWLTRFVEDAADRLAALPWSHEAPAYLESRGVAVKWRDAYRIGWLPDPHGTKECPEPFWKWLTRYGWNRLVFPLTDPFGHPLGVQFRSVTEKGFENWVDPSLKLLSPACFGLHEALPCAFETRRLIVVEGIFDYFAVRPYATDVLALLTSTASVQQRRLLARYCTCVVALLDMDAPGRRGCLKLAGLPIPPDLRKPNDPVTQRPKLPPFQVLFPAYTAHDPDDLRKAGKFEELQRLARLGAALPPPTV